MHDYASEAPLFDTNVGVDVYCVHGVGTQTPYQFKWASSDEVTLFDLVVIYQYCTVHTY